MRGIAKGIGAAIIGSLLASCAAVTDMSPGAAPSNAVRMTMPPASVTPADQNVLFWSDAERQDRFSGMERWFPGHEVEAGPSPRPLPPGDALPAGLQADLRAFMQETNAAGVIILQDGKVRFEDYAAGFGPEQRWTSFSVAKSFTSTLLGAAIRDGFIASLDDSVAKYIPEMQGTPYEDVTVRQLATMTSGIRWNEDYTDPNSDVARMGTYPAAPGEDQIVNQLRTLPREAPAGEKWVYKTGETNLLGVLVERATGTSLAEYAKENIVDPAGFAGDMFWMVEQAGRNIGGCCLSLRLADYARFGQFALEGGGDQVPEGWFAAATAPQVRFSDDGAGYGYQWWTYPGATWGARGIFGQSITVLPQQGIVMAVVSNWKGATDSAARKAQQDLAMRIAAAAR